jgi:hypothetical protein
MVYNSVKERTMAWLMARSPKILLAVILILMALPFAKPKPQYSETKKTRTMFGMLLDAFNQVTRYPMQTVVIGFSVLTHFLPAIILWQSMHVALRSPELGGLLAIESLACLGGGTVTFFFMALSYVGFSWGASSTGRMTFVGYALTALNLAGAIAAIVTVVSPGWLSLEPR